MITKLPTLVSDAETRRLDSEIVDAMAKHNMWLPSNFSYDASGSIDTFLAVVKTAVLTKENKEAEEAAKEPADTTAATPDPTDPFATTSKGEQFSEGDAPRPARPITRMSPRQASNYCTTRAPWTKK